MKVKRTFSIDDRAKDFEIYLLFYSVYTHYAFYSSYLGSNQIAGHFWIACNFVKKARLAHFCSAIGEVTDVYNRLQSIMILAGPRFQSLWRSHIFSLSFQAHLWREISHFILMILFNIVPHCSSVSLLRYRLKNLLSFKPISTLLIVRCTFFYSFSFPFHIAQNFISQNFQVH